MVAFVRQPRIHAFAWSVAAGLEGAAGQVVREQRDLLEPGGVFESELVVRRHLVGAAVVRGRMSGGEEEQQREGGHA